jgi:hypothetical protein
MALIRRIAQHSETNKWAYIEFSDESNGHVLIVGDKEFDTEDEAIEWSKGFYLGSYTWIEPKEREIKRLQQKLVDAVNRVRDIQMRLIELGDPVKVSVYKPITELPLTSPLPGINPIDVNPSNPQSI